MKKRDIFSRIQIAKEARYFDFGLLFVVLFLLVFGMVMIYSSSSYIAEIQHSDSKFFLVRQGVAVFIGLIAMGCFAVQDYRKWKKFGIAAYIGSVILVVMLAFVGSTVNGATRWIKLPGGLNLQPAEVAKLGMILFLAQLISLLKEQVDTRKFVCLIMVATTFLAILIYLISNNLSSAVIVVGIVYLMMFVASNNYKTYALITLIGVGVVAILIIGVLDFGWFGSFRSGRIMAWKNPEAYADNKSFQTLQALYAVGSGGFFGKGLGASMQKLGFIPEAQNDMIFSIIAEELGLFGAISVILLFVILIWRCIIIAINAEDLYGSMIVVGVMAHIAIQVILNIAVVTNTIPNTGISLPFISYGGSSVVFLLIEVGLVLSVSREIRLKETVS